MAEAVGAVRPPREHAPGDAATDQTELGRPVATPAGRDEEGGW